MRYLLSTAALLCMFAAPSAAQSCSTLVVNGSGNPNTKLEFVLTGADANSLAFLALSQDVGTTTRSFGPLGSLELALASPVAMPVFGRTDAQGDLAVEIRVPPNFPAFDLKGQAVTGGLKVTRNPTGRPTVGFVFCTSNVVDVKGGK